MVALRGHASLLLVSLLLTILTGFVDAWFSGLFVIMQRCFQWLGYVDCGGLRLYYARATFFWVRIVNCIRSRWLYSVGINMLSLGLRVNWYLLLHTYDKISFNPGMRYTLLCICFN